MRKVLGGRESTVRYVKRPMAIGEAAARKFLVDDPRRSNRVLFGRTKLLSQINQKFSENKGVGGICEYTWGTFIHEVRFFPYKGGRRGERRLHTYS